MFEPIYGSAFDIIGIGIANPVATFWTAAEMLEWLGEAEAAAELLAATEAVYGKGVMTVDLGGTAHTEVTQAVYQEIRARQARRVKPIA
jgi:tartrate dehydrogenase/decarboxylase / D-malate dehydrogenase